MPANIKYTITNKQYSILNIPGGRIVNCQSSIVNYEYNLTDHLGNVRVTFAKNETTGNAEIIQEDHYYPFGMRMSGQHFTNTELLNKFLYNGKELQDQTGYYDYGFRQLDPQLGRWHVIDAMAEKYMSTSPYAYVMNNPISHIDVMGLYSGGNPYPPEILNHSRTGDDEDFIYRDNGWAALLGLGTAHHYNRELGQTGADYDKYEVSGLTKYMSLGEWYAAGEPTKDEYFNSSVATDGTTYVGTDAQEIFKSIKSGMIISLVDFNGDLRLVASTDPLVAGYFSITLYGIEYSGDGYTAVYLGAGASISEYKNSWLSRTFDSWAGGIAEFWEGVGGNQETKRSTGHPEQVGIGRIMSNASVIYENMAKVPALIHNTLGWLFHLMGGGDRGNELRELYENDNSGSIQNSSAWVRQEMKADGIMPDTMFVTYPNDTILNGTDLYIKFDTIANSHYLFRKTIK